MLQYQKVNVSEGFEVNKTSASKECMLFAIGILNMLVTDLNCMFVINVTIY